MPAECAIHKAVTVVSAGTKGAKKAIRIKDVNMPTSRIGPLRLFFSVNKATGNDNVHNPTPQGCQNMMRATCAKIRLLYIRRKTVTTAYKIIVQKYKSS